MASNSSTFKQVPNPTSPGYAPSPFALSGANPVGSNYATTYTEATTSLLQQAIFNQIIYTAPKQYDALKYFLSKTAMDVASDEFKYFERLWGRTAMTVSAVAPPGPGTVRILENYASASEVPVAVNDVIYDNAGAPNIVTAISWGAGANVTVLTVSPQSGIGASTFTAGEVLAVQGPVITDGLDTFQHYDRIKTVERYNFVEFKQRNRRWGRIELLKYQNTGTTDFLQHDKSNQLEQLRADLYGIWFAGVRGEIDLTLAGATSAHAKQMGGIYPTMVAAGAPSTAVTLAGLQTAFETFAFATNYKSENGRRVICATDEMLYEISKLYKEDGVRYTPNDKVADLNLMEYKIGSMRLIPVSCELFKENSLFPTAWKNRIIVVDDESLVPVKLKGTQQIEMGQTNDMFGGSTFNYVEWWAMANLSCKFVNPVGGFIIDVL